MSADFPLFVFILSHRPLNNVIIRRLLQNKFDRTEELNVQQSQDIAVLSAQRSSFEKKSNRFKETVKSLNEVNRVWEESYNAQSDDLFSYGKEISRLNNEVLDLKRALASNQHGSDRVMNREMNIQTLQGSRP